ncbi:MAG TPA: cytochrome c [Vicinamibacterales bacterium]|nr:cytochrome c [Vicinamibacterales bacterium]
MQRILTACLLWLAAAPVSGQTRAAAVSPGETLFQAQCGFCHGRDATGGASGPDLTDSELVAQDRNGDKLGPVIRTGRPERGMPGFPLSDPDLKSVIDFIHARKAAVDKNPGRRRRVTIADLSTGNADAGRAYFNGAGGCAACHSPTGDLASVGARYRGLGLLMRFLYPTAGNATQLPGEPRQNPVTVTVTLPTGETVTGPLVFRDEFTIALRDADGWFRSWPQSAVKVSVKDPVQAHADQLGKYTDDDVHNLFAYLQTLVK